MSSHQYANVTPTAPWRCAMTLPRELALQCPPGADAVVAEPGVEAEAVQDRLRLIQRPVRELAARRVDHQLVDAQTLAAGITPVGQARSAAHDIELVLHPGGTATDVGLELLVSPATAAHGREATRVGVDRARGVLYIDRSHGGQRPPAPQGEHWAARCEAPLPAGALGGAIDLRIVVDTCSVEVFALGGSVVLTDLVFPLGRERGLALFAEGGDAPVGALNWWSLG
jgi:sucrose-6-phosphate hydrolase SacC (GH32 family)